MPSHSEQLSEYDDNIRRGIFTVVRGIFKLGSLVNNIIIYYVS